MPPDDPAETRVRSAAKMPDADFGAFGPYEGIPAEDLARNEKEPNEDVLCVVWRSRSAGDPHFVTIIHDPRGRRLQCVCTSAAIRGDCWAVEKTRRLFGWPEPERT